MRGVRSIMVASLLSVSQLTFGNPLVVSEIPVVNCRPDTVTMSISYNATNRQAELAKKMSRPNNEILGMASKYKGPQYAHRPVKDYWPAEDVQRLDELSSQMLHFKLKVLAESQLDRDVTMVYDLLKISKDDRDNKLDPKIVASVMRAEKANLTRPDYDDAKKYIYLHMLRQNIGSAEHTDEKDKSVCSLGLALETEIARDTAAFEKTLNSNPGIAWIEELRARYHVVGINFDPTPMTADEKNRLLTIQAEMGPLVARRSNYWQDLNDLRFFIDVAYIKYLDTVGYVDEHPTIDVAEIDRLEDLLFKDASKEMKSVRQLWNRVSTDFPDSATKSNQYAIDYMKKNQ